MNKRHRIGPDNPLFITGKTKKRKGYVQLCSKIWGENQGRYEHQIVAEASLGRPLQPGEIVHHRNLDKHDNRPENLEVLPGRREHAQRHGKGKILCCSECGKERWYSPSALKKRANPQQYRCRRCSYATKYDKTCQRCQAPFQGAQQSRFCDNCTCKT